MDYDSKRPLTLWGAGYKGKEVAKLLIKDKIPFYWICNNPKKIDKKIHGKKLFPVSYLEKLKNPQSIITVANEKSQKRIRGILDHQHMKASTDYFFFC